MKRHRSIVPRHSRRKRAALDPSDGVLVEGECESRGFEAAVVGSADQPTARQLEKTRTRLRKQQSQWVYFDRNLRIYEGTKTFVFKPLQRFHWTESQAMQDASEIIAETLQFGDESA